MGCGSGSARARLLDAAAPGAERLLRLHRHSLAHLMVLGGTCQDRLEVVRTFHEGSPARGGPLVLVDCAREEHRLRRALQAWLAPDMVPLADDPVRHARTGTLFLDDLDCLAPATQRLVLMLARWVGEEPGSWRGPRRLAVGSGADLDEAVRGGVFSRALHDCLDKVRVELPRAPREMSG